MAKETVDKLSGKLLESRFGWMDEARKDLERSLTVHVVTLVCMRAVACRVMHQLRDYQINGEIEEFGVGFRFVCALPEGGLRLIVDRGVVLELGRRTVVVVLPDDALCGGATVTSRWTCLEV